MKSTLIALALLVAILGFAPTAISSETESIFDSNSYLHGEAGLTAPIDRDAGASVIVNVPMKVWLGDRDNFYVFTEEKSTNLTGLAPDFNSDYLVGEGGIVAPIERSMEQ